MSDSKGRIGPRVRGFKWICAAASLVVAGLWTASLFARFAWNDSSQRLCISLDNACLSFQIEDPPGGMWMGSGFWLFTDPDERFLPPTAWPEWCQIAPNFRMFNVPLWAVLVVLIGFWGWFWYIGRPRPGTGHCASCGYDLRLLSKNRCPECGRAFNPEESVAHDVGPPGWTQMVSVGCAYLVSLVLTGAYWNWYIVYRWGNYDWTEWSSPLLYAVLRSGCGPLVLVPLALLPSAGLGTTVLLLIGSWTGILAVLWKTRLHRLPWRIHLILGLLWCYAGAAIMSVFLEHEICAAGL